MATEQVVVKIQADISRLEQQMKKAENQVNGATRSMTSAIKQLATATATVLAVKKFISYGDAWSSINSKIRLVTGSTQELLSVQNDLYKTAQDTRSDLEGTVTLYTKLSRSSKELGLNQEDLVGITKTVNQAMIVSGASAVEAKSALLQLSQGMASGVLRGEELNSVMENTPRLSQAIADGMGVTIGQLRSLGADGKLTSETVVKALQGQAGAIAKEFSTMPQTVGQAMTKFSNSALRAIGKVDESLGITKGIGLAINQVTLAIDKAKQAFNVFSAFVSAILTKLGLTFDVLGSAISMAFTASFQSAKETFNILELRILQGITNMANSFNSLSAKVNGPLININSLLKGQENALNAIVEARNTSKTSVEAYNNAVRALDEHSILNDVGQQLLKNNEYKNKAVEKNKELAKTAKKAGEEGKKAGKETAKAMTLAEKASQAVSSTIGGSLSSAFKQSLDGAIDWGETMKNMLKDVIAKLFEVYVIQRLIGGVTGTTPTSPTAVSVTPQAQGGVWAGGTQVQAFAKGGVVDSPTNFGMSGNNVGLMGEAGAEAIMPLGRMSNGDLGVQGTALNVNVINNAGVEVETSQDGNDFNILLTKLDSALSDGVRRGTNQMYNAVKGVK